MIDKTSISTELLMQKEKLRIDGNTLLNQALDNIEDSFVVLQNLDVTSLLESLFIIPLELFRLAGLKTLDEQ